jgi:hypothetical protein
MNQSQALDDAAAHHVYANPRRHLERRDRERAPLPALFQTGEGVLCGLS